MIIGLSGNRIIGKNVTYQKSQSGKVFISGLIAELVIIGLEILHVQEEEDLRLISNRRIP